MMALQFSAGQELLRLKCPTTIAAVQYAFWFSANPPQVPKPPAPDDGWHPNLPTCSEMLEPVLS